MQPSHSCPKVNRIILMAYKVLVRHRSLYLKKELMLNWLAITSLCIVCLRVPFYCLSMNPILLFVYEFPLVYTMLVELYPRYECVMKPAHKKILKIDQHLRIQPLRGGNLLYMIKMNNSWMIQMTIPPLYM